MNFTNDQIFVIFKNNKKILHFLFKEQIIIPNNQLFKIITNYKYSNNNYPSFFYPEFKSFFTDDLLKKNQIDKLNKLDEFDKKRQIGENDNYICHLIRNDLIDEFVIYVSKTNLSLSYIIQASIFETNNFLYDKTSTLIEYASFYGSIQIFQYLRLNGAKLTPSLGIYAIHGKNPELIHLLEENQTFPSSKTECLNESIKCHHNEITDYILKKYYNTDEYESTSLIQSIKYYNFLCFNDHTKFNSEVFYYLCIKDYFQIVNFLLNSENKSNIDINYEHEKMINNKKEDFDKLVLDEHKNGGYTFDISRIEKKTSLITAIEKGNQEIVEILLKQNNVNVKLKFTSNYSILMNNNSPYMSGEVNKSILFIAVEKGYSNIVQILINRNDVNVNEESFIVECYETTKLTPLHIAIENEDIEIIKILLKAKDIDTNCIRFYTESYINCTEKTPLILAIEKGNSQIVQLLLSIKKTSLDKGYHFYTNVAVDDGDDYTETIEYLSPLKMAEKMGNNEIIQILAKKST